MSSLLFFYCKYRTTRARTSGAWTRLDARAPACCCVCLCVVAPATIRAAVSPGEHARGAAPIECVRERERNARVPMCLTRLHDFEKIAEIFVLFCAC